MAVINIVPTCSECGCRIYEKISANIDSIAQASPCRPQLYDFITINPPKCPHCGAVFERIVASI